MIAFDTNVAVYVINNHPEFVASAIKIIERAEAEGCCLSVLLITEVLAFNRSSQPARLTELEQYLGSIKNTRFIACDELIARQAADFLRQQKSLRIADAIHVATAVVSGATEFWTNDQKLAKLEVSGLRICLLNELAT